MPGRHDADGGCNPARAASSFQVACSTEKPQSWEPKWAEHKMAPLPAASAASTSWLLRRPKT